MGRTIVRTFAQGAPGRRRAHLWSGETVVTVRGHGIGGRNLEVALAAVPLLERAPAPVVLATRATDGVDGPADAAGAIVDSETAGRLRRSGLSPRAALAENDSFPALRAVGVTQVTGPSGTNVGDVALILG
jgi:hydroxypyruvate reductase